MIDDTSYQLGTSSFSRARGLVRDGATIPLPPRVRNLLLRLIEADGALVGTRDLLAACAGSPASLWQAIYLLRRALGGEGDNIVQTAYGKGVRLCGTIGRPSDGETQRSDKRADHPGRDPRPAPTTARGHDLIRTAFEVASHRSAPQVQLARATLRHAERRFPDLALAISLQADTEIVRMVRGYERAAIAGGRAMALVERALAVDPRLPSALATKGMLVGVLQEDLDQGLALLDAALESEEASWIGGFYKAWLLIAKRDLDAAHRALDEALEISPLERGLIGLKGWLLCAARRYDVADAFVADSLALRPDIDLVWIVKAMVAVYRGDSAEARASIEVPAALHRDDVFVQANRAWVMARVGQEIDAVSFLSASARSPSTYVSPMKVAMIRTALGDRIGAANAMRIAEADRDPWRLLSWCEPRLEQRQ